MNYINDEKVKYVNDRILELYSLKSHKYDAYRTIKSEYSQYKRIQKQGDYARYRMNTGFALVNSKAAEILSATPSYDFVGLDEEGKRYTKIRKLLWNYVWATSNTDYNIMKIVYDAMKYGTGWGMEYIRQENRTIKEPKKTKDGIIFEEKEIVDYDGCYLEHLSWENVFVNGADINETTEAFVVTHYDRDEFFQKFGNNNLFSNVEEDKIPKGKYYYVPTSGEKTNLYLPTFDTVSSSEIQSERKVSVGRYWNKYTDEYIVLANGVWINPTKDGKCMGIISPNKEIPLVCFTDHPVEDDIWAMGEYEITKDSRDLKDESRSLVLEVIKAQAGLITIDPLADWDEATLQLGIRKFARVGKEDIGFFAPNINASTLQYLEGKLDEDIIIESGVDFKNQLLGPGETATKTAGRIDASKKRINLGMKYNAYTFFERLGRLRMSNIAFFYSDKEREIFVKGEDYTNNSSQPLNGGYGTFTIRPEYLKGECTIIPQIDSLMGESSEKNKQKFIEFLQLVINMRNPDGSPTINPKNIIEAGRGIIDDVVDLDKLLEKTEVKKSGEDIINEMDMEGLPTGMGEANGAIPPSQRSGAPITLASTPNM